MAYPKLELLNSDLETITEIDFGDVNAGGYSSEIELKVFNSGSVTAYNVSAKLLNENNEEAGDAITQKWIEYKIGKEDDTATPLIIDDVWRPMGLGSYPDLRNIETNKYRTIFLRIHAPIGVPTENISLNIALSDGTYPVIYTDLDKVLDDGIFPEEGIISCGVETNSTDTFIFRRTVVKSDRLIVIPEQEITLDQNDGEDNSLIAGEKYYAVVSYSDGELKTTKGVKGENPAIPEVEGIKLLTVTVLYDAEGTKIDDSNISWDCELSQGSIRISNGILELGKMKVLFGDKYFSIGTNFILLNEGDNWIHITNSGAVGNSSEKLDDVLNLYKIEYPELVIYDLRHFIDSSVKEKVFNEGEAIPKGSACDVSGIDTVTLSEGIDKFVGIAENDILDTGYIIRLGKCEALVSGGEFGDSLTPLEGKLVIGEDKVGILLERVLQEGLAYIEL